jgi:hypothetical protein
MGCPADFALSWIQRDRFRRSGRVSLSGSRSPPDSCDAVLRIPGESKGADQDVRIALERGLPVFHSVEEIPVLNPTNPAK